MIYSLYMAYDFKEFDGKLHAAREWLTTEYLSLRTGRATPTFLDSVMVEAYGSHSPLKQVANVGVEDAKTLRITPYDPSLAKDIERAIAAADLGVGVTVADTSVRVIFPELTMERREELVKVAKQKLEEARITVRSARHEVMEHIETQQDGGEFGEDEMFRLKEDVQKKVDAANAALEEQFIKKETEMLSS